MAVPVIMPRQGQSVESCIITEWMKQKGDEINEGDILFSYETDKASFEEEAPESGILLDIFFEEGDEVPVLTNVAVIGKPGESTDSFQPENSTTANNEQQTPDEDIPEKKTTEIESPGEATETQDTLSHDGDDITRISPRARSLAEKLGIAYKKIQGTGPEGRIIERDVQHFADTSPRVTPLAKQVAQEKNLEPSTEGSGIGGRVRSVDLVEPNQIYAEDYEEKKLTNIRKIIAKSMYQSLQNSAQLTHHISADARNMLALRKDVKAAMEKGKSENITLNDMVCYAVIKALKKHPAANSHFLGDSIRTFNKVHLGIAVDTERGLMVPTIRNADDLSLAGLSGQIKALAEQCKTGNIAPELINSSSASFTVSNLGAYGVEMFTPVLNLPQVGILGVNTIIKRPADLGNGAFGFIPFMGLSLTYDHRAIDGAPASAFLREIKIEIENLSSSLL